MTTKTEQNNRNKQEIIRREDDLPAFWRPSSLFDQMRNEMLGFMNEMMPWSPRGSFQPTLNLYREGDNLMAEACLPGIKKEDIQLNLTRDRIVIRGEYREEERDRVHTETRYGSFHRSMTLPAEVDPERVEAQLQDGLLRVTMPLVNPERSDGKQIEVK